MGNICANICVIGMFISAQFMITKSGKNNQHLQGLGISIKCKRISCFKHIYNNENKAVIKQALKNVYKSHIVGLKF